VCSYHHSEGHPPGHWQNCEKCITAFISTEDLVGKGASSYNFIENKWDEAPTFEPLKCTECEKVIKMETDPHTIGLNGYKCMACVGGLKKFRGNMGMMDGTGFAMTQIV
jgi:hypothetical protein